MNKASRKKAVTSLLTIVAIVLVGLGAKMFSSKQVQTIASTQTKPTALPAPASTTPSSQSSLPVSGAQLYKDGTYTAEGAYLSPGGDESIVVSITVAHDTISDSTVQSGANDPTAIQYQADFINNYKPFVVGKPLNSVHVSVVSGSSLTSQGFNNALDQIKRQAKS